MPTFATGVRGRGCQECCLDEWYVVVEVPELAEPDPTVPDGDAPENLPYSACFRDAGEIRPISEEQWARLREGRGR